MLIKRKVERDPVVGVSCGLHHFSFGTVVRKEVDGMKCHSLCVLLHTQRYISGELQ